MAFRPFITNLLGLDGTPESGGLLQSYVKGTTTPSALYSDAGATPLTNPIVADSLGQITAMFNDALQYSWQARTADSATVLWSANVVGGVLSLTYVNPEYAVSPLIEVSWVPALGAPLGTGWSSAFGLPIPDALSGPFIKPVATYAEMTALPSSSLVAGGAIYTLGRAAAGDGGEGSWLIVAGTSTDNGGTVKNHGSLDFHFVRQFTGPALADWFGFSTAASASSNATALAAAMAVSAQVSTAGLGEFAVTGTIDVPAGCQLLGRENGPRPVLKWGTGAAPSDTLKRSAVTLGGDNAELIGWELSLANAGDFRRTVSMGGFDDQVCRRNKITLALTGVDGSDVHYTIFCAGDALFDRNEVCDNDISGTINRPGDGLQMSFNRNGKVLRNRVHDFSPSGATKFYWALYISQKCYGTEVADNEVEDVTTGGIHVANAVDGAANDYGRRINNNHVKNVLFVGVSLDYLNLPEAKGNIVATADLPVSVLHCIGGTWEGGNVYDMVDPGVPISANKPLINVDTSPDFHINGTALGEAGDAGFGIFSNSARTKVSNLIAIAGAPVNLIRLDGADSSVSNPSIASPTATDGGARIRLQGDNGSCVGGRVQCSTAGQIGVRAAGDRCVVEAVRASGGTNCIWLDGTSSNCTARNNVVDGSTSSTIANAGTNNIIENNSGWVTQNEGAVSTTTDASGDVTVTHSLAATPLNVLATAGGTTFMVAQVHTITSTTFKIRFFDIAGAALAATAVTAYWEASV